MATIMIEDAPESFVKAYGERISYKKINLSFLPKKRVLKQQDPTIRLQKLMDDPENTSYGPMCVEDFISEMKKW